MFSKVIAIYCVGNTISLRFQDAESFDEAHIELNRALDEALAGEHKILNFNQGNGEAHTRVFSSFIVGYQIYNYPLEETV